MLISLYITESARSAAIGSWAGCGSRGASGGNGPFTVGRRYPDLEECPVLMGSRLCLPVLELRICRSRGTLPVPGLVHLGQGSAVALGRFAQELVQPGDVDQDVRGPVSGQWVIGIIVLRLFHIGHVPFVRPS